MSNILWDSSDHHADGNVVVVRHVFLLVSVTNSDRVEGVITNNLSETLESNRLDVIEIVLWGNLDGDWFNLINWDIEGLGPFLPLSGVLSFGGEEVLGSWSSSWGLSLGGDLGSGGRLNNNVLSSGWLVLVVLLVVLFVVVLLSL